MKGLLDEALCVLEERRMDNDEDFEISSVDDLQQSGYLTNDDGLVICWKDGRKFIVTIQEV